MSDHKIFKKSPPCLHQHESSSSVLPLSLSVLGHSVPCKKYGSSFMLDRVALEASLPCLSSDSLRTLFKGKKRASLHSALGRPFISWNLIRVLFTRGLLVFELKDMLNTYIPFVSYVQRSPRLDRLFTKDTLNINSLHIPFKVSRNGVVYLDILGAFTLIGRLKLAMTHQWKEVDEILSLRDMGKEEAFDPPTHGKKCYSNRSYVTMKALLYLAEELVLDEERKRFLSQLLTHLISEVDTIRQKWSAIYKGLESSILAIQNKIANSEDMKTDSKVDTKPGEVIGTESCHSGCGRKYHFTLRCCRLSHFLRLADKDVGYIVKDDQIFLDKCNSFSALGRMYVIRCSDYRKSDKILESSGMDPKQHYLLEQRNYSQANPRNRRTHISLEAFITLVHMGFADSVKNSSLFESIKSIIDDVFLLKERCENYFRANFTTEEESEDEILPSNHEESGIESGTSSDASGSSGKISPSRRAEDISYKNDSKLLNKVQSRKRCSSFQKLLDFQVLCRVEKGNLYLELNAILNNLFDECYRFIPKIKKLVRLSPEIKFPFFPVYFKKSTGKFISVDCILCLIEKDFVKLNARVSAEDLKNKLTTLSETMIQESIEAQKVCCATLEESESISLDNDNNSEDSDSEDEGILENSNLLFKVIDSNNKPCLNIEGLFVPFQIVNDVVYLDKKTIFQLLKLNQTGPHYRAYITIDRILEESNLCLDDAFLYEGRKRSFISTKALKALIVNDLLDKPESREALIERLHELENQKESLKTNRILNLTGFEPLPFKTYKNTIYVHTLQMMKVVGFSPSYVDSNPSKAYVTINKLLSQKGINVDSCFLKQGKSKYVYISLHAVMLLFQTEFGPFKEKEKLKIAIIEALKEHGLVHEKKSSKRSHENNIQVGVDYPRFKYRISNDMIYIHRKSLFEHLGLQKVIMSGSKGFAPINAILTNCGLNLETCYIKSRQEKYSYMSLEAILLILDSQEPLMVCLQQRERFLTSLLLTIQGAIGSTIASRGNEIVLREDQRIPFKFYRNRVYLLRHTCYSFSGLYDKTSSFVNSDYDIYEYPAAPLVDRGFSSEDCFVSECGDEYAYISIDAFLILMNLDGDLANRSSSFLRPQWQHIISAINHEVPKLKIKVKMEEFRSTLIKFLVRTYLECLKSPNAKPSGSSVELIDLVSETEDDESTDECTVAEKKIKVDHFDIVPSLPESDDELINSPEGQSTSEFESIKAHILASSQNGMIGNWEIKRIDYELVRLVISPSFGSSRKMSFIHPDVAALLSYEFLMQQDLRFAFFINERQVPSELVRDKIDSLSESGILNFLYQLLTLRPCFGSFNPELVETVGKGLVDCSGNDVDNIESLCSQVFVDKNFIGSSQNGRTYAGTVRSKKCKVLADFRVSDTCSECAGLNKLVINRSMLTDEALRMEESSSESPTSAKMDDLKTLSSASDSHQRSVWKIESTNALGCNFVCPQIQSFNSSPPHKFVGSQQATSIVVHRVEISSKLEAKVTLNGRDIHKIFNEFRRNKQVGHLLDQVASLRFCLGYPDAELVEEALYIINNIHLMNVDVRKYFQCITVDESFCAKMTNEDVELRGTLRARTCRFISEEFADLCDQCHLLQEPLESMGI